ncbi:hypothetical protein HUW51_05610 [Adhaeribacter swui]|uniref:Lipocalin-like domain-containing protein n=1 Tax=Adhaeribacter swui TaxID=2086471 RepID=A0A7G7G4Z7_9BACT|nr:lipocalin family protein [Adhaeribacter swui]QNF32231.1 hypothetical protein HUW51_05610 [Adhaeribacter swui]
MNRVFLLFFSVGIISCDSSSIQQIPTSQAQSLQPQVTPVTTKFAGNYMVKSDRYSINEAKEIYVLKYDGTAKWMFVDVNETIPLEKTKYGVWHVNGSTLNITYQDENSLETEQFVLDDGCFYDQGSGERYLQLTQLAQIPF